MSDGPDDGVRHSLDADIADAGGFVNHDVTAAVGKPLSWLIEISEERYASCALAGCQVHRATVVTRQQVASFQDGGRLARRQFTAQVELGSRPPLSQALRERALIGGPDEHQRYGR